jgi:catechol 2,3-dioxygenase-like lactoylglutathione lyase family enzyme
MTNPRIDHVSVVVDDLDAATAFFAELGLEVEGRAPIEGRSVDLLNRLDDVRAEIVMMRTPDGHGKLELTVFHAPAVIRGEPENAPPNTLGLRSVMLEVDDVHDAVERLHKHGGKLVGEIAQFENGYVLAYVRGPAGIIVSLAEAQ